MTRALFGAQCSYVLDAERFLPMLWFYERDRLSLHVETLYDNETAEYVVTLHHPDGSDETQRFDEQERCRQWLVTLVSNLEAEQWKRDGPPIILSDGWPDKPPVK